MVFFDCWGRYWAYKAIGDCCSVTWFEDINNKHALLGHEIIGLKIAQFHETQIDESKDEHIQTYGYTLTTSKGYIDIEYRNSSNGYYGGSCEFMNNSKLFYKDQFIDENIKIEITKSTNQFVGIPDLIVDNTLV